MWKQDFSRALEMRRCGWWLRFTDLVKFGPPPYIFVLTWLSKKCLLCQGDHPAVAARWHTKFDDNLQKLFRWSRQIPTHLSQVLIVAAYIDPFKRTGISRPLFNFTFTHSLGTLMLMGGSTHLFLNLASNNGMNAKGKGFRPCLSGTTTDYIAHIYFYVSAALKLTLFKAGIVTRLI